jgi:colicin import membrane protein
MVDLWETLPEVAPPAAVKPPRPPAEPAKVPEPAKDAPVPKAVVDEPPPPKTPDIALEKKKAETERLKKLQAMQVAEEKARAEAARAAQEKQLAEQKKRELLRQMEDEDMMRRMTEEQAANEARLVKQSEARAVAGKRQAELARIEGQYRDLISAKVRGNTRLPDNLTGNPEVRFRVKLRPTGEVVDVLPAQSSGNAAYDQAVERAIWKSSPLPLPSERDARIKFGELTLIQRPKE